MSRLITSKDEGNRHLDKLYFNLVSKAQMGEIYDDGMVIAPIDRTLHMEHVHLMCVKFVLHSVMIFSSHIFPRKAKFQMTSLEKN